MRARPMFARSFALSLSPTRSISMNTLNTHKSCFGCCRRKNSSYPFPTVPVSFLLRPTSLSAEFPPALLPSTPCPSPPPPPLLLSLPLPATCFWIEHYDIAACCACKTYAGSNTNANTRRRRHHRAVSHCANNNTTKNRYGRTYRGPVLQSPPLHLHQFRASVNGSRKYCTGSARQLKRSSEWSPRLTTTAAATAATAAASAHVLRFPLLQGRRRTESPACLPSLSPSPHPRPRVRPA